MSAPDKPGIVARGGEVVRHICDRFWLFTIAAIALTIVGVIVVSIVIGGKMPTGADAVLTSAVTGLLMIAQKVIDAQSQRRMADQLAQSRPPGGDGDSSTDTMNVRADEVNVRRGNQGG